MDFSWTPEQLALRSRIVDFAKQELDSDVLRHDRESIFPRENWEKCARAGLLGLAVPKKYPGGDGSDLITAVLAMEGLGYGCHDNGLAFAINGQLLIRIPIVEMGTENQKQHYLPPMCRGRLTGCFAFTEPDSGSDLYSLRTRAVKQTGGYVLNGIKKFVTFAPIADFALVLASARPENV